MLKTGRPLKAKKESEEMCLKTKPWFLGKFDFPLPPVKCYSLFETSVDTLENKHREFDSFDIYTPSIRSFW